jgi:hypothetical protein
MECYWIVEYDVWYIIYYVCLTIGVYGMSVELWNVDLSLIDLIILYTYNIPQLLIVSTMILRVDFRRNNFLMDLICFFFCYGYNWVNFII